MLYHLIDTDAFVPSPKKKAIDAMICHAQWTKLSEKKTIFAKHWAFKSSDDSN